MFHSPHQYKPEEQSAHIAPVAKACAGYSFWLSVKLFSSSTGTVFSIAIPPNTKALPGTYTKSTLNIPDFIISFLNILLYMNGDFKFFNMIFLRNLAVFAL